MSQLNRTSASQNAAPAALTPQELRTRGNRLAREHSLYLRQHAHNPMDWYPWGDEALARARELDKPIFLSIGYASCHWCHVMEHEVFEDDEVAAFMNEHFVNIKVDREERPDLDAVYMEAVQLLTGGGGWPMSVFLTPQLRPFYGGTYFPRDAFLVLTDRIMELYRTRRSDVDNQGAELARAIGQMPGIVSTMPVDDSALEAATRQAASMFDPQYGGFRGRMKFPTPIRWLFLLHRYRRTGDETIAKMLRTTLDQMAAGGLRDHVGGGFHRYTVDATWLVPHFEKMLYDNAQLATLYLEASVVFSHAPYAQAARDALDFLLREMTDEQGGVFASFDADSGGEEGSYYVWTPDELRAAAGERNGQVLAALFDATDRGNFEGSNVLTRRVAVQEVARRFELEPRQVEAIAEDATPLLRAWRDRRPRPGLDRKVVTAWNGLAISAFALGYRVLGDERYRAAAERAAAYLWTVHQVDGRWSRASNDGVPAGEGTLDDYAFVACAMLDLHQATGDTEHLQRAARLVDDMVRHFAHAPLGFVLTREDGEAPLGRKMELFDSVEPSGNAAALHAMLGLATLTGDTALWSRVEETLRSHADRLWKAGSEMSWWLDAAQLFLAPMQEVIVAGAPDDERTQDLVRAVRSAAAPHVMLVPVPPDGADESLAKLAPTASGKTATDGTPTAYVCEHGTCKRPTTDRRELVEQMMAGWKGSQEA